MKRLRHALKAYLMTLRMTKIDTIIYVEGGDNDPIYYQHIKNRYSAETGRTVDLREASELPNASSPGMGGAGGKQALLRAAKFSDRWRSSLIPSKLDEKEIAFCVDKDVDDLLGMSANLPSVIYTRLNSVENHLVLSADLHHALSLSLSATLATVSSELGNSKDLKELSTRWREWVIFCILATRLSVTNVGTFKRASPLNTPAHSSADQALARTYFNDLKLRCPQLLDFDDKLAETTDLVDRLITADRFDEVFKGKWYVDILYSLCESCPSLSSKCRTTGKNGIWVGIRASFVLSEMDYSHYERSIKRSVAGRKQD
jgi:hypothetical protein